METIFFIHLFNGIENISLSNAVVAKEKKYSIKLVANAKKLEKDGQELIRFSVSQNDNNADVIDINAEVINVTETGEGYTVDTVEEGFFRNQGLSFIYQPQIEVVSY